jgi:hypothetical protein
MPLATRPPPACGQIRFVGRTQSLRHTAATFAARILIDVLTHTAPSFGTGRSDPPSEAKNPPRRSARSTVTG